MKRRSETSPRDPPRLRTSSVRGFNGVRSNPQFTANAVRNNRVKFTVRDADPHPHDKPTASSERHESARPRRSDVPKTSEYAFFKKLKKDARCSESSVVHEEVELLKISEPSGSIRDLTTVFRDNFDRIRPSIHLEKARLNSDIFSSPPQANVPKNLEGAQVVENNHNDIRTPILAKRVDFTDQNLLLSPPGNASQKSGPEELDWDMFSQKRMRLRQWVAESSVPEVEKLCSKGYDLVSALLSRLLPDGDQSKHCRDKEATPMSTDTKYSTDEFLYEDTNRENFRRSRTRDSPEAERLLYLGDFCNKPREIVPFNSDSGPFSSTSTSQHLSDKFLLEDTYNRKSHWTKSRDRIEADCVWDLDDDFSKSRKMIPLYLDSRITTSPSASHVHFQYGNNKQYFNFDDGTTSIFSSCEPYFRSDLEAYGSSSLSHIKEQNKFQDLDESEYGRGSDTMLLGWNFANLQDKRDLCHPKCDKEMNLLSTLIAPLYDHHLCMHNSFGVHEPHSILLDTDDCSDITLFPFTHLEKLNNWDSRFFQEDKLLVAKLEPYPLPLSYVPKCLDISEDHDTYMSCNINDGISLQHNNWVIKKVLSEQHHSELEPLLPFGHGLNTYRKCLPSSGLQSPPKERTCSYLLTDEQENFFHSSQNRQSRTPCAEDTVNILEWPSLNLQKPSGTEIVCPFLLNNSSSWLPSEEGNHDDDHLMF